MRVSTTSGPHAYGRVASALMIAVLTVVTALATAGPASSSPGQIANSDEATFVAQAQRAELTNSQASQLQNSMNGYLARLGGTQVSANKIEIAGKGYLLVVVPGERYARDLSIMEPIRTQAACPYQYFCMYRGTFYTGSQLNLYYCQTYSLTDWVGTGSYINNQTKGALARLINVAFNVVTYSTAYEAQLGYNWDTIYYVDPC